MNERIRELAEQSTDKWVGGEFFDREKFAELIVVDVIDILSTYRNRIIFEDGFEYNCKHPIQAIKEHFGVKQ